LDERFFVWFGKPHLPSPSRFFLGSLMVFYDCFWWVLLLLLFSPVLVVTEFEGEETPTTTPTTQQQQQQDCTFKAPSGNLYNFTSLIRTKGNGGDYTSVDTNNWAINMNLCAATVNVSCGSQSNMCQTFKSAAFSCSDYSKCDFTERENGVDILCGGGTICAPAGNRETLIQIKCNTNVKAPQIIGKVKVEASCRWVIEMESEYACRQSGSSLGGGWIVVITLLSLAFVYLVGGAIYVKLREGHLGVPHRETWSSLCSFSRDGVFWITSKITRREYDPVK